MGQLTPFGALITSVSAGTWIQLIITLGAVALTYFAMSRIIAQAGYSSIWILLPIAPVVLTIICYVILWHDLNAIIIGGPIGFFGVDSVGLFWHLDQIAFVLNWIFFLVFAFSRWPGSVIRHVTDVDAPSAPQYSRPVTRGPGSGLPAPPDPVIPQRVATASAAGPGATPAVVPSTPGVKKPGAQFCAWCGEALPGNRALFHDCGSRDRPETHCKNCGTVFVSGSSECASCATE